MIMDVIVDGGNVIKCDEKVIMTDKVFVENKEKDREFLQMVLEESFGCEVVSFHGTGLRNAGIQMEWYAMLNQGIL